MSHRMEWVIKASTLCNMRCKYCYEWEDLAKKDRMPLDLWEKVFVAVRDYHVHLERRGDDRDVESAIVWHGGEPTLQPISYWREVLDLQRRVIPGRWLDQGRVVNSLQTNLFSISDEWFDFFAEGQVGVGVSYDHVDGVRLTAGGKETEGRVRENMRRLRDRDIGFGVVVVLAGHNVDHLRAIHDDLLSDGISFRVLPLFDGPDSRPMEGVSLDRERIVEALCDLFVHWFESGCRAEVAPLSTYLWTAVMRATGLDRRPFDRAREGEVVFVVRTDGAVFEPVNRWGFEHHTLGNLRLQSLEEILGSPAYRESLERNAVDREATCGTCTYRGPCNTFPIFATPDGSLSDSVCHTAEPVTRFIEHYLAEHGFDGPVLAEMMAGMLENRTAVAEAFA